MDTLKHLRETPWETRNLGVPAYAVVPGFWDDPDFAGLGKEMRDLADAQGSLFALARLGKEKLPLVPQLQALGFYVVESTVTPTMALHKNPVLSEFENDPAPFIPGRYRRDDLEVKTLHQVTPEWARTLTDMARESFTDDRFHHDHQCPPGIADQRFAYWMQDLLRDSTVSHEVLLLRGSPIAFIAHRRNYMIVAGFAPERTTSGLGEFFWLSACSAEKTAGQSFVHTQISCNNLPSLNLCARIGFRFKDIGYTFHFWKNPPS